MKNLNYLLTAAVAAFLIVGCGGDDEFIQIEQIARPGVNELFVVSTQNSDDYNARAPGTLTSATTTDITTIHGALVTFATNNSLTPVSTANFAAGFLPDVMRFNTAARATGYGAALCGTSPAFILCGGRKIEDDVIETSLSYILTGGVTGVDDGVTYAGESGNAATGHTAVRSTFPYLPAPYSTNARL